MKAQQSFAELRDAGDWRSWFRARSRGSMTMAHEERSGGSDTFEIDGRMGWPR
jgi:hypothetical protein